MALTKTKFCTLFPNGAPPGICMACDAPSSKRPRYTVLTPGVALRFRKGRNGGAAGQWTCMTYQMRSPIFSDVFICSVEAYSVEYNRT